jgi:hypothetical protein
VKAQPEAATAAARGEQVTLTLDPREHLALEYFLGQ